MPWSGARIRRSLFIYFHNAGGDRWKGRCGAIGAETSKRRNVETPKSDVGVGRRVDHPIYDGYRVLPNFLRVSRVADWRERNEASVLLASRFISASDDAKASASILDSWFS